jgi:hypothetical protein
MALGLIEKVKAGSGGNGIEPDIDSNARIVYQQDELAAAKTFRVNWVQSAYIAKKDKVGWIGTFREDTTVSQDEALGWELVLTASRMTLWSPLSVGITGKMKEKAGAATGGQIYYKWIDEIGRDGSLRLEFLFDSNEHSSTQMRTVIVEFRNPAEAWQVCNEIANNIEAYWRAQGVSEPALTAELDKLRQLDWNKYVDLKLSLFKAGAPVKYIPDEY